MSGIIGSKLNIRGSGRIAKLGTDGQVLTSSGAGVAAAFEDAAGGGLDWQSVETGSTMTAVAGNGYWIDTTSNACTITLPATASNGDEIMFVDYDRTWGTNKIIIDSNGLNYQGYDDAATVEYETDGTALHIVYSGATNGWIPTIDEAVAATATYGSKGIFGYGLTDTTVSMTNLVSDTGVVASDVTGVGTARYGLAACEYGGDKGIFGFAWDGSSDVSTTNLVSNVGVVGTDVTGVGTARRYLAACSYGEDKGIFGYGYTDTNVSITNLVSNAGVVASDQAATTGTARHAPTACEYGGDKGIFGFGNPGGVTGVTNLVSNAGVVASDVSAVGTARDYPAACSYGEDKGIFGFGDDGSVTAVTNLVSNSGVVASDQAATTGTARDKLSATQYGGDKGIFGFGSDGSVCDITNLVSNAGVVATDVTGVGTARYILAACSWGS
jgi:hypothetical protein